MIAYKNLASRILSTGVATESRAGNTLYRFGESISFNLDAGFPCVTIRKIDYKQAFGELAAFIRGYTRKSDFEALGCRYWDRTQGIGGVDNNLGYIYGAQWRSFCGMSNRKVDQLDILIKGLKTNPFSRRHILTAWQPAELDLMALPPCHIMAQWDVTPNGHLNCIVYMRSVDVMLGLPYDIILYALLTHLLAEECSYYVGQLTFFFGNTHIYQNHVETATRMLRELPIHLLPTLDLGDNHKVLDFDPFKADLVNYQSGPSVKFELNL